MGFQGMECAGRMFICVNAERARVAANKINKGAHDFLVIYDADEVFAAHPALMGRHLETLTVKRIDGKHRPCLTLSGYEFAPKEIFGQEIPHPAMAPGMAFELLTLAYSVILRNRAKEHVKSASAYILDSGERIVLEHGFIKQCAGHHKWPANLSEDAMQQLRLIIESHSRQAADKGLTADQRSLAMSQARLVAAYALWAGCNGARPEQRVLNPL